MTHRTNGKENQESWTYWAMYHPNSELLSILPSEFVERHQVLPLCLEQDKLILAAKQPLSVFAQSELRVITSLQPHIEIWDCAPWDRLYINYQQGAQFASHFSSRRTLSEEESGQEIVRLSEAILSSAWQRKASDIHLEPQHDGLLVRFRIDGLLQEYTFIHANQSAALVSRFKLLAGLDSAQRYEPQDGHLKAELHDQTVNLRVATMPVNHGEKLVLRFLYREIIELSLQDLGMAPAAVHQVKNMLSRPYGLLLVTGPTGSGKTTTLYAALNHLRASTLNITSIEDPIEYDLSGVNQIAVNMQRNMTFARGLRGILRQDPDIIMVGEIRDRETADIALSAAITGRLVLSSLHTNDACGAILRLLDMGVEPYMITAALTGVIGQRLVRRLCPFCSQTKTLFQAPQDEVWSKLWNDDNKTEMQGESGPWTVAEARGCEHCHGGGYSGRVGAFEVLEVNEHMKELVKHRPELSDLQQCAKSAGWQPLLRDGWRHCLSGTTDMAELTRVLCFRGEA